ncbi:MAG: type II toxin-antitoxin system HicA family toxin [Acidobacteria bacterium]|nr:type II toxin-antitoxin system HicA family toxin [Acidobacteriota bacterium]
MPAAGRVKRADLIRCLRTLGFRGPYAVSRHQFMVRGDATLRIPNPHQGDIGTGLLPRLLKQAAMVARRERWPRPAAVESY